MGQPTISAGRRTGAVLVLALLAGIVAALPFSAAVEPVPSPNSVPKEEEPFFIRRVVLSRDRAAQVIEQLGQSTVMPLSNFNDLVRRATRAQAALQAPPPRLISASYTARLEGENLRGNAHWRIINPNPTPALLPLQFFTLALLKQPQFANGSALLADFDDRSPALLVDGLGEHSLMLDWSSRGDPRPGGLRFDLRFPPAVVAQLELDLPRNCAVSLDESVRPLLTAPKAESALLSGPHDSDAPNLRRWTISCPGRAQVAFRVRSLNTDGNTRPIVLCRQETTQVLRLGSVEARYKFLIEAPRRAVSELLFECDSTLLPWDVTVQGPQAVLKNWETHRERGGTTRLSVRFAEPVQAATVLIDALAPLRTLSPEGTPVPVAWISPNLRALGVVHGGERLELKFDPDLRLEDWQPGDFRLMKADEEPDADRRELFQRLTLLGGGLVADGAAAQDTDAQSRRPAVRLLAPGTEHRARQLAWWQVRSVGESLAVQVSYEVTHGVLERLPLLLPWDWDVEEVKVNPGLLKSSRVDRGKGRPILLVELNEPLRATPLPAPLPTDAPSTGGSGRPTRRTATLTVRLRPRQPRKVFTFPDTDPLGRFREGGLAIDVDEQAFQAVPRTPMVPGEPDPKDDGPWAGQPAPLWYYPSTGQPITGTLDLKPRPGKVKVQRCATDVFLASGRPAVEVRLTLEAQSGSADAVEVTFSEAGTGPWEWRSLRNGPPLRSNAFPSRMRPRFWLVWQHGLPSTPPVWRCPGRAANVGGWCCRTHYAVRSRTSSSRPGTWMEPRGGTWYRCRSSSARNGLRVRSRSISPAPIWFKWRLLDCVRSRRSRASGTAQPGELFVIRGHRSVWNCAGRRAA